MSQYEKLNIINKDEYEVCEINQLSTQNPGAKLSNNCISPCSE